MKRLPVAITDFRAIRDGGYVYVDKTRYIHGLLRAKPAHFLSRPRGFGKTLLLDTMERVFRGERELFKGLWIDSSDYDWEPFPVIRLDMSGTYRSVPVYFEADLIRALDEIAEVRFRVELSGMTAGERLKSLVSSVFEERNRGGVGRRDPAGVVVLIDGYDSPVAGADIDDRAAKGIRSVLAGFYSALKSSEERLRFVFITGEARFGRTSVLSKLDRLNDITLRGDCSSICGITPEEMESCLGGHLDAVLRSLERSGEAGRFPDRDALARAVLEWYGGYSWDGRSTVLCPYSLLSFLSDKAFGAYWSRANPPSFIAELIRRHGSESAFLQRKISIYERHNTVEIGKAKPAPLMFQTGYLAIRKAESLPSGRRILLAPPNHEVRSGLFSHLLAGGDGDPFPLWEAADRLRKALTDADSSAAEEGFETLIGCLSRGPHVPLERVCLDAFFFCAGMLGHPLELEVSSECGRVYAVLDIPGGDIHSVEMQYLRLPRRGKGGGPAERGPARAAGEAPGSRPPAGGRARGGAAGLAAPEIQALLDREAREALGRLADRGGLRKYQGSRKKVRKTAIVVCEGIHVRVAFKKAGRGGPSLRSPGPGAGPG
ncbi:MAG: AAA family ATPase [Deltaproteobacteria bacterium]|nr:AAA family ATPase [Deltaproteobacteria bacterium]